MRTLRLTEAQAERFKRIAAAENSYISRSDRDVLRTIADRIAGHPDDEVAA